MQEQLCAKSILGMFNWSISGKNWCTSCVCMCTYKTTKCTALYIGTVDAGVVSFTDTPPPAKTTTPVYNEESTMLNIFIITCNFRWGVTLRWHEVQKCSRWGEGLWADKKNYLHSPLTWHLVSIWGKIGGFLAQAASALHHGSGSLLCGD